MSDSGRTRDICTHCGMGRRIANRCPECGRQTLVVGNGGWLTCSWVGCAGPSEHLLVKPSLDELVLEDQPEAAPRTCATCRHFDKPAAAYPYGLCALGVRFPSPSLTPYPQAEAFGCTLHQPTEER